MTNIATNLRHELFSQPMNRNAANFALGLTSRRDNASFPTGARNVHWRGTIPLYPCFNSRFSLRQIVEITLDNAFVCKMYTDGLDWHKTYTNCRVLIILATLTETYNNKSSQLNHNDVVGCWMLFIWLHFTLLTLMLFRINYLNADSTETLKLKR